MIDRMLKLGRERVLEKEEYNHVQCCYLIPAKCVGSPCILIHDPTPNAIHFPGHVCDCRFPAVQKARMRHPALVLEKKTDYIWPLKT